MKGKTDFSQVIQEKPPAAIYALRFFARKEKDSTIQVISDALRIGDCLECIENQ
jgi:hypothetical protein